MLFEIYFPKLKIVNNLIIVKIFYMIETSYIIIRSILIRTQN